MNNPFLSLACLLLCSAAPAPTAMPVTWSDDQINRLTAWIDAAPTEAINFPVAEELIAARKTGETERLQSAATAAALQLANAYLFGNVPAKERADWNIDTDDDDIDLRAFLGASLAKNDLDSFYRALRPQHKSYEALRLAFATETDPARRIKLARNMERWRWMPLSMGNRYLLVNTAAYEVGLWENGRRVQFWPVIVGKHRLPTPVFSASVSGVTYNPWWDIPASIVAESVGALSRKNPAEAKRRGYVWNDGHYRQRPGPRNALGQMKLIMPNAYSVFLHDTPNKTLFQRPARAFSHGCIRVGRALEFASILLAGTVNQKQIDAILASGKTTSLSLSQPMPVYIAYFTADVAEGSQIGGAVQFYSDHYGRDAAITAMK
jgi:L,D-transpeptidase YcbB